MRSSASSGGTPRPCTACDGRRGHGPRDHRRDRHRRDRGPVATGGRRDRRRPDRGDRRPVACRGGRAQRVEAGGSIVAPGFVDIHSHSDLTLLSDGRARQQGRPGRHHRDQRQLRDEPLPAPRGRRRADAGGDRHDRSGPRGVLGLDRHGGLRRCAGGSRAGTQLGAARGPRGAADRGRGRGRPAARRRRADGAGSRHRALPRRWRGRRLDGADVSAGDVGRSRRARGDRPGRGSPRRRVRHPHAQLQRPPARGGRRGADDRAPERLPPAGLAPCGRRPAQLGQGAARPREDRAGAGRRRRCRRRHLPVHRGQRQPVAAVARVGAGRRTGRDRGAPRQPGRAAGDP